MSDKITHKEKLARNTVLINEMIERLIKKNDIDIATITNGEFTFGEYKYDNLVFHSMISGIFSKETTKQRIDEDSFLVVTETPEGYFVRRYANEFWNAFPSNKEVDLVEDLPPSQSVNVLLSLLD